MNRRVKTEKCRRKNKTVKNMMKQRTLIVLEKKELKNRERVTCWKAAIFSERRH